jgi:hypothetical protein
MSLIDHIISIMGGCGKYVPVTSLTDSALRYHMKGTVISCMRGVTWAAFVFICIIALNALKFFSCPLIILCSVGLCYPFVATFFKQQETVAVRGFALWCWIIRNLLMLFLTVMWQVTSHCSLM